jgi:taurine dioxygenase
MRLSVTSSGQACGARVEGVDLTAPLGSDVVAEIRAAWLKHHVLAFPNQAMSDDDLERFTLSFGPFGQDPFIAPIAGRSHVIAVKRMADEQSPLFAENWHSDWSFQATPPAGTCLFGITIPPIGGDTLFANQHAALDALPAKMRARLEGKVAIHSAVRAYAPTGAYGANDKGRSMDIRSSEDARLTQRHALVRPHRETGRLGLFGTLGYIVGIEGIPDDEAQSLLGELYRWQSREEFQYRHQWEPGMLLMWDNRSLLHAATGGYQGYDRLLHRTTIGERV